MPVQCSISWAIRPTGSWSLCGSMYLSHVVLVKTFFSFSFAGQVVCSVHGVSNVCAEISSSYNTLPTRSKIRLLVFRLVLAFSCTNIHPTPCSLLEDPKSENGSFSTDSQIDHILNRPLKYLITPKKARKQNGRRKMHLLSLAQGHQSVQSSLNSLRNFVQYIHCLI